MKVTLVHNPDAGMGIVTADHLLETIADAGYTARYQSSKDPDWQSALDSPADIIAVAGGDGIVGKVAKRCVGRGTPIAVLPLGTANNIARTLGLTDTPLDHLVQQWHAAPHKKVDMACATGPWGSFYFIEGMGVGIFTEIMSALDARGNVDLAHLSAGERIASVQDVIRNHLSRYRPFTMKVFLDGRDLSGDFILMEALNIQSVGPNLCLAPDANPADGLLDLALFYEGQRDDLIDWLIETGKSNSPPTPPSIIPRGRRLELQLQGHRVHIDDEVWSPPNPTSLPIEVTASINGDSLAFLGRNG
ncbi:MAG TPA: diacylglycerol kinase family protein [Terriglobia bacterium]|nr:diacylglycerol kinase family protein [Terriglobia bacterium]